MVISERGNAVESDFTYVNHIIYYKNIVTLILLKVTNIIKKKFIYQSNIKKMKLMVFFVALTIPLMSGVISTGYQSSIHKKETAQAKGQDFKQDLTAARKNTYKVSQKEETDEEWKKFNKSDFELKIKANEMRIIELNVKIRKPGELLDPSYAKKIANLEKENWFLTGRLEAYEKHQNNLAINKD